ncbi:hypothetical protein [Cellulomonas endophytica]|uniref:hypothetical protein n=1 Tax=Cellulomonas endophytica TaxID=2494735 RepID=UPI001010D73D|nr:hypothetical protein [Cellulomonas endophytica]
MTTTVRFEGGPLHGQQAEVRDGEIGATVATPAPVEGGRYVHGPSHELSDRGDVEPVVLWEPAGETLDLHHRQASGGDGPGAN